MSENHESIEGPEIRDEDIADFIDHGGEKPEYHPLLKVWREVLSNAPAAAQERIEPQWASRITSMYREIDFADMPRYRDAYFGKVMELASILESTIEADEDCLTYTSAEEDAQENAQNYRDLLTNWQLQFVDWELAWDCTDADAAVELAAISEVHKMFFTESGLVNHLDSIGFQFTEADREELAAVLAERKEG